MQNEIKQAHPLLNQRGELMEAGYAKTLLLSYQRNQIKAHPLRIKEWDYYCVVNDDFGVALTIADNSYMGLHSLSFLDFKTKTETTRSIMTLLPMGKTALPASSVQGDVQFSSKSIQISFQNDGSRRILKANMPNFRNQCPLKINVVLDQEPEESMVIVTPFAGKPKAFYYNQKINCLKAHGMVEVDGKQRFFEHDNSFGVLDWGRGVWTYSNTWYWASASGRQSGKTIGFNLGYGFGDNFAATENMLFVEGKAHKIEQVTFLIPQKNKREDYLSPWKFTSSDGRFEADFVPILDRAACTSAILIKSDQHQVFGYFSGEMILDDGTKVNFKNLLGFAEKVKNRW